jgi:hypothetical protein
MTLPAACMFAGGCGWHTLTTQASCLEDRILEGLRHTRRQLCRRFGTEDNTLHLRQLCKQRLHIDAPAAPWLPICWHVTDMYPAIC